MTPTPTPRMIRFAKVSTALLLVGGVSLAMRVESQSSKKVGAKKDAGKSVSQKGAQKASPAQTASQNVAKPAGYVISIPNTVVKISMLPIPAGEANIGGQAVKVKPFFMASTETTWEAFDAFLASGPSTKPYDQTDYAPDVIARPSKSYILPDLGWGHRGYPAINLSFINCEMFCRWLSKVTGKKYRFPTEAEWEWACRGGVKGELKMDDAMIDKVSWNGDNSQDSTHPVGKKLPNGYGLFDMLGNVGEWATDSAGKSVLCGPTFEDATADVKPTARLRWEPSWQESDPQIPKSRWWLSDGPFVGFRIVCDN